MPSEEQKKRYLEYIGFKGTVEVNYKTLKEIVELHCFAFPFQTHDVHNSEYDLTPNRRSSLRFDTLFHKLIDKRRGGRCIELNIMLQTMLKSFGFSVDPILPSMLMWSDGIPKNKRRRHTAAIVTLEDEKYLIDASSGNLGPMSLLPLKVGEYRQFSERFKLISTNDYPYELQVWQEGKWTSLFGFDTQIASSKAYQALDDLTKNSLNPDCVFKELNLCSKPVKRGQKNDRYYIRDNVFGIIENGKPGLKKEITTQDQYHKILKEYFGIDLKGAYIRFTVTEMKAHLIGIERPPLLHQYASRLKEAYLTIPQVQPANQLRSVRKNNRVSNG